MAIKKKANHIEPIEFDDWHRGTSITLPVNFVKSDGTPFELEDCTLYFTLKQSPFDYDYDDDRALISKEFKPYPDDDPNKAGRIDINLTSKETWLPPGSYYFDLVLMRGVNSQRLLIGQVNFVGGPTNRNVRHDAQDGFVLLDPIQIGSPLSPSVNVESPLLPDPPRRVIEGMFADPNYLISPMGEPVRAYTVRNYGPRVSLMMTLRVPHDSTDHSYYFEKYFLNNNLPAPCPLKDGYFVFNNRKMTLKLAEDMDMVYSWNTISHDPKPYYDGGFGVQESSKPILLGDNTSQGTLTMHLNSGNDQVHIDCRYFIPDDVGDFMYFMMRVDWFNWVDPYEPDPEHPDVGTRFPEYGCSVPDTWEGYWPPDMWYCYNDKEFAKQKNLKGSCSKRGG